MWAADNHLGNHLDFDPLSKDYILPKEKKKKRKKTW